MKSLKGIGRFELLTAALFACLFSFLKFNQCRSREFSASSTLTYFCYSDIPVFWKTHFLQNHIWPFDFVFIPELSKTINPVEYPVIIGLVIWVLSYLTSSTGIPDINYFDINVIFISLLFIGSAFFVHKIKPKYALLMVFAPAVIMSLFMNWDMWAVLPSLIAIYYFDKGKHVSSAIFLSVAISAKFYPIVMLLPICILLIKSRKFIELRKFLIAATATYLFINLPIMISNFSGWSYFYKVSFNRGVGYGSIWEVFEILGLKLNNVNYYYFLSTFVTFFLISIYFWRSKNFSNLHEVVFLSVFAFAAFNKVYSPQFVLWLTPLAVLALKNKTQVSFFAVWQLLEAIYHLALWRYFYQLGGGQVLFAVSPEYYAIISALRLLALVAFALSLVLFSKNNANEIQFSRANLQKSRR